MAVLLKALAVILGQKRGRVGAKGQLVDKDDHLLPVLKRLLHKVKGKFQRVRSGGNSLLAALYLTVEGAAHCVERIVRVQPIVKLAAPRCQQGNGAGAGRGLIGQQAAGTLVSLQPLAVAVALLGKQVGGVCPGLLAQRPLKAAQLLVAGVRHSTGGACGGKAGVQPRQQQAYQTDALIEAGVHRAGNHGVKRLALQNILDTVVLMIFAVQHPVGGKIPRYLGVAQVLGNHALVHGQPQRVGCLQIGRQILPAARGHKASAVRVPLHTKKVLRGIALRRRGSMSLTRPAAGGESCVAGFYS